MKLLLSAGNEGSRSYRVTNQHSSLPCNFMTHGFLDPSAFSDLIEDERFKPRKISSENGLSCVGE